MIFVGQKEGEQVPFPLIMDDAGVESHREVGGDEMVREGAGASRWNVDLLGSLQQVQLRSLAIPASDVDRGMSGQVGYEVAFVKLIDSLLHWHHLERAQGLRFLELLHVQGS
jgi:hypothetical protein